MSSIQVKHLDPESSSEATFDIDISNIKEGDEAISETYSICNNTAMFCVLVKRRPYYIYDVHVQTYTNDGSVRNLRLDVSCSRGLHFTVTLNTGRNDWVPVCNYVHIEKSLSMKVYYINLYPDLYEDKDFTDFELLTEGTSVCVHRNILMMASPVLGKMVLGDWKEAKEGHVQVPGISAATLQHFKDYIYLKKLPDELLECTKLFSLASYYIMPELKEDCIARFKSFEAEDAWCLFEYFVDIKDAEILVSILEFCQDATIERIRSHLNVNEKLKPDNLKNVTHYTNLRDDTSLTDFELSGENVDTSVFVHRNILAMSSPSFKEKLLGEWKNAKKGQIQLDGDSKDTLQHLKDYIYLKRLPEDLQDCSKLLSLAKMYDMPDLEVYSSLFIASKLTPQNFLFCFEYCMQHKAEYLFVKLLEKIHKDKMVTSLKEYFSIAK